MPFCLLRIHWGRMPKNSLENGLGVHLGVHLGVQKMNKKSFVILQKRHNKQ